MVRITSGVLFEFQIKQSENGFDSDLVNRFDSDLLNDHCLDVPKLQLALIVIWEWNSLFLPNVDRRICLEYWIILQNMK